MPEEKTDEAEFCPVCGNTTEECVCCPECGHVCAIERGETYCPVCNPKPGEGGKKGL